MFRAKADWANYIGNPINEGVEQISFTPQNGDTTQTVIIYGLATKHHLNYSPEGIAINSTNARVTISEAQLTATGFTVRDSKNNVVLLKSLVSYPDSNGNTQNYIVKEQFPDETVGVIILILSEYGS